jgi:YaiO family outer membrane protein
VIRRLCLCFAFLLAATGIAAADPSEVSLTGVLAGFTSGGNDYGPWRWFELDDRSHFGDDSPGFELVDRGDDDRPLATHGNLLTVDDFHRFSKRFFVYAALGAGSGNVLPTHTAYLEGDYKLGGGLRWVVATGVGVISNPNGTVQRYVNYGPTYYGNNYNVTVRLLPTSQAGYPTTITTLATVQAGSQGHAKSTLTVLDGNQAPSTLIDVFAPPAAGAHAVYASYLYQQWLSPRGGFKIGVQYERLSDLTDSSLIYLERGVTVGVFSEVGR